MSFPISIATLKEQRTFLDWAEGGGYLPKRAGSLHKIACPFHEERSGSFAIYDNDRGHCFGCGWDGDTVDFFRDTRGVSSTAEAMQLMAAELGISGISPVRPIATANRRARPQLPPAPRERRWPATHRGSLADMQALADLRGVCQVAVRIAAAIDWVRFGEWAGLPTWFIADSTGQNMQARRMDGLAWPRPNGEKPLKAQTLPGARASWPIGIQEARNYPRLLLVEGGPDILAALHFQHIRRDLQSWCPVGMMGASNSIPGDALPLFAGKRVRIYRHDDPAGEIAAERWAGQLSGEGCEVDCFSFTGLRQTNGQPVTDLNDAVRICHEDAHELEGLLP